MSTILLRGGVFLEDVGYCVWRAKEVLFKLGDPV